MAQRVFHPPDIWLTKNANAFMTKNLTLIPRHSFLQLKYCSEIREKIGTILPKFESLFPILRR